MAVVVPSGDHNWRIQAQCLVDLQSEVGVKMAVGLPHLSAATTAIHLMMKVSLGNVHCMQYQNTQTHRGTGHFVDRFLVSSEVMHLEWVCSIHYRDERQF
jgi:hypothetical protein